MIKRHVLKSFYYALTVSPVAPQTALYQRLDNLRK